MGALVAIAYPDVNKAQAALATLQRMQLEHLIIIDDAVIARHDGDKIKLEQTFSSTKSGAISGALWGGLFGLIFFMPVIGVAVGAASGLIAGKLTDYGVDDKFAKEMVSKIEPGQVALVLLTPDVVNEEVITEMRKHDFGGELIQTTLSAENEAKIRAAYAS